MNKSSKKLEPRDPQKTQAVKWVADKKRVSPSYVYDIINGKYDGGRSDEIRRAYNEKYAQLKGAIKHLLD